MQVLWTVADAMAWKVAQWPADTGLDAETQGHRRQFAPVDCAARPADRAQVCCFSRFFTIGWDRGSGLAD